MERVLGEGGLWWVMADQLAATVVTVGVDDKCRGQDAGREGHEELVLLQRALSTSSVES